MPTLDDLRRSLTALEQHAPDEDLAHDRVLAALEHSPAPRRRATLLPALAAACVVAIAVVTAVLLNQRDAAKTPPVHPGQHGTVLRWAFSVGRLPGYTVVREHIGSHVQIAVSGTPGRGQAPAVAFAIFVFDRGGLDAGPVHRLESGRPVHGKHVDGYFARLRSSGTAARQYGLVPAVGWQYAPGSWAVVETTPESPTGTSVRSALLRVADAVTISPSAELRLPFALHHLPAGQTIESATLNYVDGDAGPVDPIPVLETSGDAQGRGKLAIERDRQLDCAAHGGTRLTPIDGHPTRYSSRTGLSVDLGDNTCFSVTRASGPPLPDQKQQMIAIARGAVTTPHLDRPNTWIPASKALP